MKKLLLITCLTAGLYSQTLIADSWTDHIGTLYNPEPWCSWVLYNMQGRKVMEVENSFYLNTAGLARGVYTIMLKTGRGFFSRRIILQ